MLLVIVVLLLAGAVALYYFPFKTSTTMEGFEAPENCFIARARYLEKYPDVAKMGMDPWSHYSTTGKAERRIWPSCSLENPVISFCPRFAPQVQTTRGFTDCCQGDFIDGKCSGTTFCTLSPTHDKIPTCDVAWRKYFADRAKTNCPTTMPYYYEDVKNPSGIKGCSKSPTNTSGLAPQNTSAPKCRIYTTEKENREKGDSCFVERERLLVKCPALSGVIGTTQTLQQNNNFQYYTCNYAIPGTLPKRCFDDRTASQYMSRQNRNWMLQANAGAIQADFCSNFLSAQRKKEMQSQTKSQQTAKLQATQAQLRDIQAKLAAAQKQSAAAKKRLAEMEADTKRRIAAMQKKLSLCYR